jgi:hypothetical protein
VNIAKSPRDRIKLWCMVHNKTQVYLAKIVGVSKQEITHVGNSRYIDGKVVRDTAAAMGTTVDWLTKGLGPAPGWYGDRRDPAHVEALAQQTGPRLEQAAAMLGLSAEDLQRAIAIARPRRTVEQLEAELAAMEQRHQQDQEALAEKQRAIDALLRQMSGPPDAPVQLSRRLNLPPRVPTP